MTPGRLEIYGQSANCRCNRSIRKPLERLEPVKDRCNRDGSLYRVSRYYISDDLLYPFPFRFTLLFSVVVGLTRSPHGTPTTPIIHCENPCKPFVRFPRPLATVCTCTHISRVVLQRADSLCLSLPCTYRVLECIYNIILASSDSTRDPCELTAERYRHVFTFPRGVTAHICATYCFVCALCDTRSLDLDSSA